MSPPAEDMQRGPGTAPALRELVRAASSSPEAFEALAARLVDLLPALPPDEVDEALPEIAQIYPAPLPGEAGLRLTLAETGAILSASPEATARFALSRRSGYEALGVAPAAFAAFLARLDRHPGARSILQAQAPGEDAPLLLAAARDAGQGVIHLRPLTVDWPEALDGVLADLFGLSPRERGVLRALFGGRSAQAIAAADGRAVGTVRQQIKSILAKFGMGAQGQVQTFLAAASMLLRAELPLGHAPAPPALPRAVAAPEGRTVGVQHYGDPGGMPCLMLHGALYGLGTLAAERAAARTLGLRVIGVERAGYGRTAPPAATAPAALRTAAAADALAALDDAGAARAVVIAQDTALATALTLAALQPDRVAGIVAVSPTPPLSTWEDSAGMPPQQRVFALCMLRAPPLADALVSLGLARMRRLGPAAWPEAVFAGVPHDVGVAREAPNLAAVTAAYAFNTTQAAAGFRLDMADLYRDWGDLPGRVRCPVLFLHGALSRTVEAARVARFVRGLPGATVEVVADAGHTLALSHAPLILRRALRLGWEAGLG